MKSRRIIIYWLLLLVSTLAIGGVAFWLLDREEARVREAARATLVNRAETVVDNFDLILAEVKNGIVQGLSSLPSVPSDTVLEKFSSQNPFIARSYLSTPEKVGIKRGLPSVSPDGVGKADRMLVAEAEAPQAKKAVVSKRKFAKVVEERKEIRDYASQAVQRNVTANSVAQMQDVRLDADTLVPGVVAPLSGWIFEPEKEPVLVGWYRASAASAVVAAEVDWERVVTSLASAFPTLEDSYESRATTGARYVLESPDGRVVAESRGEKRNRSRVSSLSSQAELRVEAGDELPGWWLSVYRSGEVSFASGFFTIGGVLVGMLVFTMLLGGTLLMWQARRESLDAARKSTFVSNVSHELRTPLTSIRMFAEMLAEGRVKDEAVRDDYIQTIVGETQRLTRLVNNVLDFSRLDQGHRKYQMTSTSMTELVGGILETQAVRMEEAGMELERELPASLPPVMVDPDAVEQVLLNLIDNALKYAAQGKWLRVAVDAVGEEIRVTVEDRGDGIPAGHRRRIFDEFHRVDDCLTGEQSGTGLGLSIARRLMLGMGGDLTCESVSPTGSRFTMRFGRQ